MPIAVVARGGAWVPVLVVVAGCLVPMGCQSSDGRDLRTPLEVLQDREVGARERSEALAQASELSRQNDALRVALEESLREIASNPAQPRGLRLEAIERLLPSESAPFAPLAQVQLTREPDPAVVAFLAGKAGQGRWTSWTPALVRAWAREGGEPTRQELERGASGSFAASAEAALRSIHGDDGALNAMLWSQAMDGGERTDDGSVNSSPRVDASLVRRDAWTLLSRRDPAGTLRRQWIAAPPQGEASPAGERILTALRDGQAQWRVLPGTGEELRWLITLQTNAAPAVQAWRDGLASALQSLPRDFADASTLRLRHLEPIRFASLHAPQLLQRSRDELAADLRAARSGRVVETRSWGAGGRPRAYNENASPMGTSVAEGSEASGPLSALEWGDVLALTLVDASLRDARVRALILRQVALDHKDQTSEYGGLLVAATPQDAVYTPVLYPPRAKDKRGDLMFVAPDDMIRDQDLALAHYHFHVASLRNSDFAGPSLEDIAYARAWSRPCVVFTSVREGQLNADFFLADDAGNGVVLDLGVFTSDGFVRR